MYPQLTTWHELTTQPVRNADALTGVWRILDTERISLWDVMVSMYDYCTVQLAFWDP